MRRSTGWVGSKRLFVRIAVAATLVAGAVGIAPDLQHAGASPATFDAHGSVGQVYVEHAVAGSPIELRDASDAVVKSGIVDDLGSFLFRDLTPGTGYAVVEHLGSDDQTSTPLTVTAQTDVPPSSLYSGQTLNNGFGYITTRDGTHLSINVHLPGPANAGPYPTVVEYSGYDPSNPNSTQPTSQLLQALGYATVGVNIRGTGCSGGAFWYFEPLESLDGYDVIETVAAQPWVAHGKVGMIGVSYPGISQLFVAQTQPPHLAAITPLSVIADTYNSTLYPGGIFNDGFALSWAQDRVNAGRPYGEGWEQGVVDAGGPNGAQCAENQLLRHQNQDLIADIAAHPYYETGLEDVLAPVRFVDKIDVPVFMGGAWQDEQTGGQFSVMWNHFTEPASKLKLFATNGTHIDSLAAELNRLYEFLEFYVAQRIPVMPPLIRALGPAILGSQLGITGLQIEPDRFTSYTSYAAALAAYEAEPPVRILLENGAGDPANPGAPVGTTALTFASWPPPQTVAKSYYLRPDQRLTGRPATNVADTAGNASSSYVYDPDAKPATNFSGSTSAIWANSPAYSWQVRPLGKALAFDTNPLHGKLVMAGSGSVDLWLRSSAADTDLEVTLTEVRADGQEEYVQNGWLRASHRALDPALSTDLQPWHTHAATDAQPLPEGEFVPVRIALFPFAHVFRPGSRIRISIEAPGGNRPFWTFDDLAPSGTVVNEIGHSIGMQSRVVLPVIRRAKTSALAPACGSLRGQPCRAAVGSAEPTKVVARKKTRGSVMVKWSAPIARPGDTIAAYHVTDAIGGTTLDLPASALSATFTGLTPGSHFFRVTVEYANGARVTGTPSATVATT
jgi:predicted acyl esterase